MIVNNSSNIKKKTKKPNSYLSPQIVEQCKNYFCKTDININKVKHTIGIYQ